MLLRKMAFHSFLVMCGHKVATFSCFTYDEQTFLVLHDNVWIGTALLYDT
jgi:hypothetical protein